MKRMPTYPPHPAVTVYEVIQRFQKEVMPRLRPRTQDIYNEAMRSSYSLLPKFWMDVTPLAVQRSANYRSPGLRNQMLTFWSSLGGFAAEIGVDTSHRFLRMRRAKIGSWKPWTAEELDLFVSKAPKPMADLVFFAALTGQRQSDIISARWSQVDDQETCITFTQQKTGETVVIPLTPQLRATMGDRGNGYIFRTPAGKQWTGAYLRGVYGKATRDLGIKAPFHGLRKLRAISLAEAGCSVFEIMSVTGHRSTATCSEYVRGANQKRLASAAMVRGQYEIQRAS
jgi:integrase